MKNPVTAHISILIEGFKGSRMGTRSSMGTEPALYQDRVTLLQGYKFEGIPRRTLSQTSEIPKDSFKS